MKKIFLQVNTILVVLALSIAGMSGANVGDNHFEQIKTLINERAYESALSQLKAKAEDGHLNDIEIAILSAMFFAESGQPGKALALLEKTDFMTTQFESAIAEAKSRAYFKQGDLTQAFEFATKAFDLDQSNRSAQLIMIQVDGELAGAVQRESFENLLRASNNDRTVWFAYLDQTMRFEPQNRSLADRAYVELGDTGSMIEYRAIFAFQSGAPYEAFQLFKAAKNSYEVEEDTISTNRIKRWLAINQKYADRPKDPPKPAKKPPAVDTPPKLERRNMPMPKLTPANQNINLEIEPINIDTEGDVYTGSGFIANNGQWIITNRHVVEGADRAIVRDGLGKVRHVKEYFLDDQQDIAILVLHAPFPSNQAVQETDIIDPVGGDELYLMGYPLASLLGAHHPSITEGIVSKEAGFENEPTEFLITANLNQGNSGGPIFSVDGRVLGIAVAKLDKFKFLEADKSIPEDVNIGIKGKEVRRFMEISKAPSNDARPILTPRDAYTELRGKVVLIVAIDE